MSWGIFDRVVLHTKYIKFKQRLYHILWFILFLKLDYASAASYIKLQKKRVILYDNGVDLF